MQPEHDDFQTEKHLYSLAQPEINMEPKQMMMEPIISQGGSCFNQGIIGCTPTNVPPYGKSLYKPFFNPFSEQCFFWLCGPYTLGDIPTRSLRELTRSER